jgi:hypothetical protein
LHFLDDSNDLHCHRKTKQQREIDYHEHGLIRRQDLNPKNDDMRVEEDNTKFRHGPPIYSFKITIVGKVHTKYEELKSRRLVCLDMLDTYLITVSF